MKPNLKPFEHIIKILINRDGWLKIPLVNKEDYKYAKAMYSTTYSYPDVLHEQDNPRSKRR